MENVKAVILAAGEGTERRVRMRLDLEYGDS